MGVGGVYVPWDAVDVVWSLTVAGMCCVLCSWGPARDHEEMSGGVQDCAVRLRASTLSFTPGSP